VWWGVKDLGEGEENPGVKRVEGKEFKFRSIKNCGKHHWTAARSTATAQQSLINSDNAAPVCCHRTATFPSPTGSSLAIKEIEDPAGTDLKDETFAFAVEVNKTLGIGLCNPSIGLRNTIIKSESSFDIDSAPIAHWV